jgi:hypothetical protein
MLELPEGFMELRRAVEWVVVCRAGDLVWGVEGITCLGMGRSLEGWGVSRESQPERCVGAGPEEGQCFTGVAAEDREGDLKVEFRMCTAGRWVMGGSTRMIRDMPTTDIPLTISRTVLCRIRGHRLAIMLSSPNQHIQSRCLRSLRLLTMERVNRQACQRGRSLHLSCMTRMR